MALTLLVFDPHPIFRRGLAAWLNAFQEVACVHEFSVVDEVIEHVGFLEPDIVMIDHDGSGGPELVRRLREISTARVIVCSARCDEDHVVGSIEHGAMGYLSKETLTPEALAGAIRAAASGNGTVAPEVLGALMRGVSRASREVLEPRGLTLSRLTSREQRVLSLLADGYSTREVALELSYSERTVKGVLHDVVTKFNVRTRSQAIAYAIRGGLI
jgi:DNA-binding NarL/FixJ family response regulator